MLQGRCVQVGGKKITESPLLFSRHVFCYVAPDNISRRGVKDTVNAYHFEDMQDTLMSE